MNNNPTLKNQYTNEFLIFTDYDDIVDRYYKRKKLFIESNFTCMNCKNSHWLDKPIALEVDHIDGDNKNWSRNNIRAICPNCHAQTHTYRGRNINTGKKLISDHNLILCITQSKNIRQTLILAGLTPKGLNYERVRMLMFKNNLKFKSIK